MRHLLLIGTFFLTSSLLAQIPKGFTSQKLGASPYILVQKGKKAGVFNEKSNEFEVLPEKCSSLILETTQMLVLIDAKNESFQLFHYTDESFETVSDSRKDVTIFYNCIDNWNQPISEISSISNEDNYYREYNISLADGFIWINHFYFPSCGEEYLKSIQFPGEDSISAEGDFIRIPPTYKNLSGVYNLKTKHWDVPQNYSFVFPVAHAIAALNIDPVTEEYNNFFYDYYKLESEQYLLKQENYRQYNFPLTLLPLDNNYYYDQKDSSFIYVESKSGLGLIRIKQCGKYSMFSDNGDAINSVNTILFSSFQCDTIFENTFDHILLSGNRSMETGIYTSNVHYALGIKDGVSTLAFNNYDGQYYHSNPFVFEDRVKIEKVIHGSDEQYIDAILVVDKDTILANLNPEKNLSIQEVLKQSREEYYIPNNYEFQRTNNLLIAKAFESEPVEMYFPLITMYGEDSIDANGNLVYAPNPPGSYNTGVYDLNVKQWVIPQEYIDIKVMFDSYLLIEPHYKEFLQLEETRYTIQSKGGKDILSNLTQDQLYKPENYPYLIPEYKIDSVYQASFWPDIFYFKSGNLTGLANIYEHTILANPCELLLFQPQTYSIWRLEGNHLILDAINTESRPGYTQTFAFPNHSKFIIANVPYNREPYEETMYTSESFFLFQFIQSDTSVFSYEYDFGESDFIHFKFDTLNEERFRKILSYQNITATNQDWFFSVERMDNEIIVNDFNTDFYSTTPLMRSGMWEYGWDWETMDSLDANGNYVYPEPVPGYTRSGCFNISQNTWILPPAFQQVQKFGNGSFLIEKNNVNEAGIQLSTEKYLQINKTKELYCNTANLGEEEVCNYEKLNDSLLLVEQYLPEVSSYYLLDSYGLDSIDAEGNWVISDPVPGSYETGVFNVNTKNWLIQPENYKITFINNQFLAIQPNLKADGLREEWVYVVFDEKGNEVLKTTDAGELDYQFRVFIETSMAY